MATRKQGQTDNPDGLSACPQTRIGTKKWHKAASESKYRMQAAPWYRADRDRWYATIDGVQVNLKVAGKTSRRAALTALAALAEAIPIPKTIVKASQVESLVNDYLTDIETRVQAETLRVSRWHLTRFVQSFGKRLACTLTPGEVECHYNRPNWGATIQANGIGVVVTMLRWSVRRRLIDRNPIEGVRKPQTTSRGGEVIITSADHQRLLAGASDAFKPFLELLWHTGARPGEIASLSATMINFDSRTVTLSKHKTANHGKPRIIYLTASAIDILRTLSEKRPTGSLFVDVNGGPLVPRSVSNRMSRLRRRVGLTHAIAYGYRHTFATDALAGGMADAKVAALLGHASTAMIHRHYSHLTEQSRTMQEAVNNVRG